MKDFMISALPFVITGICLAIIFANFPNKNNEEKEETYLTEGMCLGMCFGVAFSEIININIGLGISLGMLIGEMIGILIKKK